MEITDKDREYFQTYLNAISANIIAKDMCIILCENNDTGEIEPILCRVDFDKSSGNAKFTPMSILFNDNPFKKYKPVIAKEDGKELGAIVLAHQGSLDDAVHKDQVKYFVDSNKNIN